MNSWNQIFRDRWRAPHGASRPAQGLIDEITRIADEGIVLQQEGMLWLTATDTDVGERLVDAIDRALRHSPQRADLLVAKYAALTLCLRADDASEALRQALSSSPQHFDARMLHDHKKTWQHLFHFPGWSESHRELPAAMVAWLRMGQPLQIVRDGPSLGLAVVNPASADKFPYRIRRSAWKLMWSKTPAGPIAFHYAMLECDPGDIRKQECGVPHVAEPEPTVRSGYWILRRLPHLRSCFVVFADGKRVLHNSRYEFTDALQTVLQSMDQELERTGPARSAAACQAAANWHMANVDFGSITF